jgi:hypothetical protein
VSYSGLNSTQQAEARRLIIAACNRLMERPADVHYATPNTTLQAKRWDGITHRKGITKAGFWPFWGDCSSTDTWILWRALHVGFGKGDIVNGYGWKAGFTGTMVEHGIGVTLSTSSLKVGDQIFYGGSFRRPGHVATYIGQGLVFTHGSEPGPYVTRWNYRSDIQRGVRYL